MDWLTMKKSQSVRRKILYSGFLFVLTILFSTPALAQKPKEIKIGLHVSLSGPMAEQMRAGYDAVTMLVEQWNKKGGVNGVPINMVVVDDASTVDNAISAAEKLINRDNVLLIQGGYASTNEAVARVSERYKTPYVEWGNVSEKFIFGMGYKYLNFFGAPSTTYAQMTSDYVVKNCKPLPKSVGLILLDSSPGVETGDRFAKFCEQKGIKVVLKEVTKMGTADYTPLVVKLKDANCDVLFVAHVFADTVAVVRKCKELDYNPKMFIGLWGLGAAQIIPTLKEDAEQLTGWSYWEKDISTTESKVFYKEFKEKYGYEPDYRAAVYYDWPNFGLVAIKNVMGAGLSLTRENVNNALGKLDIPSGVASGCLMKDRKNVRSVGVIYQITGGGRTIMFPEELRTGKQPFIYPMMPWGKR